MYDNYSELKRICDEGEVLWPAPHVDADGKYLLERNLQIWNRALATLDTIPLWDDGDDSIWDDAPMQRKPNIAFIPARGADTPRGTVIVAHGGAFFCRAANEGFYPALRFAELGFNTALLTYRLQPHSRRESIADMSRAIRLLHARAEELGASDKVAALGFSAGGMLAANAATHFDGGDPNAADPVDRCSSRPDAAVLCYATIESVAFPQGKLRAPFGEPDRAEKLYLAPERNVTPDTPPFFIWQTISDDPRNAFVLGSALTEAGVPFELHCFETGHHAVGLADGRNDEGYDDTHLRRWAELCASWLRVHGF